ncbi:MAG: multiheme c-type cytochrome [Roseibium sp.]
MVGSSHGPLAEKRRPEKMHNPTRFSALVALPFLCLLSVSGMAQDVPGYIGSQSCKSCHSDIFEKWAASHHGLAWTEPNDKTVLGDFNEASFELKGRKTRFYRKDGRFMIETTDVTGGPRQFEVKGVAGVAPLQQYLVETEPGRLQSFDVVWDRDRELWYHLYPDQELPPEEAFHWSGPYKTWNARCAECHATDYRRNYDPLTRQYQSTHSEIGVGCEACHGPAEAHVSWAEVPESPIASPFPGTDAKGFVLTFRDTSAETQIQQCAGCHSRREPFADGNPTPGTPFHDSYRLALLRPVLYHADGQIQDEVYVHGSFLQSKMYANGVRCSDCHDVHSATLKADSNAICTQCHSPAGNARFPSLALKTYDDESHHFHEPGTPGAQCVSCHMIERTYMGIDGRRDHSFRVPRPDLSVELGTPNACTDCHADRTAAWAAAAVSDWYPDSPRRGDHFARAFHAGRTGSSGSAGSLLEIALHEDFPAIVRASAIELWRAQADAVISPEQFMALIGDEDPLVRSAAVAALSKAPAQVQAEAVEIALTDPVKAVRIAVAREMLAIRVPQMSADGIVALGAANREWQGTLRARLDFPETHLALGGTALALRNARAAIRAFQEATTLDPQLVEAWVMQVRLHMAMGNFPAAEMALQRGLVQVPDDPALQDLKRVLRR